MGPKPNRTSLVLGTAGHIDHGKTALVEALTGVNTDRLPEEQARGISIELGFARLELPSGRLLGVVDVPGHERFVRTMVAGATGIDVFLLVVAADDGVMPQTREHLTVVETLAVPAGVVALTKADLADADGLKLARDDVRELLAGGPYASCPLVPVSARTGTGLEDLASALDRVTSGLDERARPQGQARLHVDRRFSMKGIGTVVTGTLWSGSFREGEEVRIEPAGRRARVRGVESHGGRRERVEAGERVALNLSGRDSGAVERGDVVVSTEADFEATYRVDVAVELRPGARPLRRGARVHLHHGTRECPARVTPLDGDLVESGRRSYAQVRLERPVVSDRGDRFVLRSLAPPDTIGGGRVLDPAPRRHGPGSQHIERLASLENDDPLERLAQQLARASSGLDGTEADGELLERLRAAGAAHRVGRRHPRYFAPTQLDGARTRMLAALESGNGRLTSSGALADAAGLSDPGAAAVLEELVAEGQVLARGPAFAAVKTEPEHPAARPLLDALRNDFIEPRGVDALGAAVAEDGRVVRALLEDMSLEGRLVRVKPGIFFHPDALDHVRGQVVAICGREGSVTIARLRDELGTSRKYAQALLEHFDRVRLTRRDGDVHVLRRGAEGVGV